MANDEDSAPRAGFGTFKGVFTPSVLTILGVILYLRLGWVLGQAGLVGTLVIVTLATAVTFVTGLSIAATATNMHVGIGGAYFMVSRSLGLQAGAAVGIPLFLAQSLGVAFYVTGFVEVLARVFPSLPQVPVAVATLVVLAALAWFSANLALRAQYVILAIIVVSLLSFILGGPPEQGFLEVTEALPPREGFWIVFAVFFPAVTGIEAGIAMSGDLEDPGRSLPRGTLAAVLVGFIVYTAVPLLLFYWVPREVLLTHRLIVEEVAVVGELVLLGVVGATLSSALGALLGGPRTLQALARDRVLPSFLARTSGPKNEPRLATAVTLIIATLGVLLGSLDVIAPVLSMFFLASYATLNLSAGLEGLIDSPSWRPTLRTPWWLSIFGAALCLVIMFMINSGATFVAAFVCGGIYYLVGRRRVRAYWGDMNHGLLVLLARFAIYRLADHKPDARTWRPNILVLSGSPQSRWHLIELAQAMVHQLGFLTVASIVRPGSPAASRVDGIEEAMSSYLTRRGVHALVRVHLEDDVMEGASSLMQSSGLGPLVPNTLLLGAPDASDNLPGFAQFVRLAWQRHRNLILVHEAVEPSGDEAHHDGTQHDGRDAEAPAALVAKPAGDKVIDIWWRGKRKNAGLMLALGHLLQHSRAWSGARLRLRTVVATPEEQTAAVGRLTSLTHGGRLETELEVVVDGGRPAMEVIADASSDADLIVMGLRPPDEDETGEEWLVGYQRLREQIEPLGPTVLVLAAEEIDFERIFE